ncbi:MAG TPA: leucine--tRNA ligase [Candidatus Binatia bacterium]|jgi:leucyl-tRNA synthetase|nr:leucine--tRNA ligase [Candidatus Binatia bacterium]
MEERYHPQKIEEKWQKIWEEKKTFRVTESSSRPKYYVLEMFPYPSGRIHMGHVRVYAIGDVLARYKRMRGYNVLHPMGWDAFGLPAENAAIERGVHPAKWTMENIAYMRDQLKKMGISYDWDREIATCDPEYYRWEQLIFIRMLERGLAYRKRSTVNWCPSCQTVLANEQVEGGRCWRCESEVTKRDIDGWFFKITAYAEELLDWCDRLIGWPERVVTMQKNWIGRSEGAEFDLPVVGRPDLKIRVFTTRPDTAFGMTYAVLAPEHPLVDRLVVEPGEQTEVERFRAEVLKQSEQERIAEDRPKRGLRLSARVVNPFNAVEIPLFIADYVLMSYGTGAIMAVPGEDQRDWDFAKAHGLDIIETVSRPSGWTGEAYTGDGIKINSGFLDGLTVAEAKRRATDWLVERGLGEAKINYRLRDWGISRQRYWGAPIPVIYCDACGMVPEKEENLPVVLPRDVQISGKGGSPLASHPTFVSVACPRCGGRARRETDTMDTFVESSWYFLRYCSPSYNGGMVERNAADYWMPVDQYIGGIEHAVLHLLYARFYTKVLRDLGLVKVDEPFKALLSQGMVVKDGAKMSKSKGNVVSDDVIRERYGADTGRLFELFAGPPEKDLEWSDQGVEGAYRFLTRVWRFVSQHREALAAPPSGWSEKQLSHELRNLRRLTHRTIKRVTEDIELRFHFNTAIAAIMELFNAMVAGAKEEAASSQEVSVIKEALESIIILLFPFVPHIASELWESLGQETPLEEIPWPTYSEEALEEENLLIVVQVDGRVRGRITVPADASSQFIEEEALADPKVKGFLAGKEIQKVIQVPRRLVNIVLEG